MAQMEEMKQSLFASDLVFVTTKSKYTSKKRLNLISELNEAIEFKVVRETYNVFHSMSYKQRAMTKINNKKMLNFLKITF